MTRGEGAPTDVALLVAAEETLAALAGRRAPWRETAVVGGLRCVRLGLDTDWATQARAMSPPTADGLAAALRWLRARSPSYVVTTRAAHAHDPVFADAGLRPGHELPAYVVDELQEPPPVEGLAVRAARTPREFLTAYGDAHALLVTPADLADPDHIHLVGLLDGQVVGCALARHGAGTGYVSAVTVPERFRRRGIGAALSAAATRAAADRGWRPVWLHATESSAPIYQRLGYRLVDVHVQLRPTG